MNKKHKKGKFMGYIEEFFSKNIMDEHIYIYGITSDGFSLSNSINIVVEDIKEKDIDDRLFSITINDIVNIFFDEFFISEDCPHILYLYRDNENTVQIAMSDDLNEWTY
jgi:hypothetical protein